MARRGGGEGAHEICEAGASVTGNTAGTTGGGIANNGTVILEPGSDVSGNDPNDCVDFGTGTDCP